MFVVVNNFMNDEVTLLSLVSGFCLGLLLCGNLMQRDLKCVVAVLIPLLKYQQKHPHNYILLGLFTVSISLTVGVTCANTDGWCHSSFTLFTPHSAVRCRLQNQ